MVFEKEVTNKGMERADSIGPPFWGPNGQKSTKQYKISIVLVNDVKLKINYSNKI